MSFLRVELGRGVLICLFQSVFFFFEANSQSTKELCLKSDELVLTVDPHIGGRIASLMFHGVELLAVDRDKNDLQWGSTVWPSPQRDWHWPPPQEIDRGVYRVNTIASDFVEIESPENTYLNLKLIKRFELLTSSILRMTYVFVNTGQERIKVGIWENTRIPYEGLVSWKTGTSFEEDIANLDQNNSLSRLALRSHSAKKKLFIDSEGGWLTYQKGDVSLTKQFQSLMVGEVAPGQMPMEVYFDPKERFAELEVHGPYTEVDPGDSTSFSVVWCLKLTK